MTGQELTDRLLKRVGEVPASPAFFRQADALAALNEAQRLFVLMTLCLEADATVTLAAGGFEVDAAASYADWLVCLAIRRAADGKKVQPSTLGDLGARNPGWQAASGSPERYAVAGFSMLYFDKTAAAVALTAKYARGPVALTLVGSAEIPEEYQPCLLDYAQVRMRLHQGAQLLAADVPLLKQFFDAATKCAAYVRERSKDLRYDAQPPEVKMPDFSRVLKGLAKMPKPMLQETNAGAS